MELYFDERDVAKKMQQWSQQENISSALQQSFIPATKIRYSTDSIPPNLNLAQAAYIENLSQRLKALEVAVTELDAATTFESFEKLAYYSPLKPNLEALAQLSPFQEEKASSFDAGISSALYLANRVFSSNFNPESRYFNRDAEAFFLKAAPEVSERGIALSFKILEDLITSEDIVKNVVQPLLHYLVLNNESSQPVLEFSTLVDDSDYNLIVSYPHSSMPEDILRQIERHPMTKGISEYMKLLGGKLKTRGDKLEICLSIPYKIEDGLLVHKAFTM